MRNKNHQFSNFNIEIFDIFFADQVSSIPIVDDSDSLLDIYCRRLVFIVINIIWEFYSSNIKLSSQFILQSGPSSFSFFLLSLLCSDITALAKDRAYTRINLEEMTVHQVSLDFLFSIFFPFLLTIYFFEIKLEKKKLKCEHVCLSFTAVQFCGAYDTDHLKTTTELIY